MEGRAEGEGAVIRYKFIFYCQDIKCGKSIETAFLLWHLDRLPFNPFGLLPEGWGMISGLIYCTEDIETRVEELRKREKGQ